MRPIISICLAGLAFSFAATAIASPAVAGAQQALKDLGFYFGDPNGELTADTQAALRRFQMRNGLAVTGALDAPTVSALQLPDPDPAAHPQPIPAPPQAPPAPPPPAPENAGRDRPAPPAEARPRVPAPKPVPRAPVTPQENAVIFRKTPYENAPAQVQSIAIQTAQESLERRGFFRGPADGIIGPQTLDAVADFQARHGLPISRRFDFETLNALQLLPGQRDAPFEMRRGGAR